MPAHRSKILCLRRGAFYMRPQTVEKGVLTPWPPLRGGSARRRWGRELYGCPKYFGLWQGSLPPPLRGTSLAEGGFSTRWGPGMSGPPPCAAAHLRVIIFMLRAGHAGPLRTAVSGIGGSGALGGAQRAPPVCFANTLVRLFAPQGQTLLAPQFRCAQLWSRARNPATPDSKVEEGAGR